MEDVYIMPSLIPIYSKILIIRINYTFQLIIGHFFILLFITKESIQKETGFNRHWLGGY